jgi:nucleoid DNA-binding protein
MALPLMTQTQLIDRLTEETGYSKSEIRVTLTALSNIAENALLNCERVKVAGVVIAPALKKAQRKRMGRNPQTGEEVEVAAKPASVRVKLTASRQLKDNVPSVQKLKRRMAA